MFAILLVLAVVLAWFVGPLMWAFAIIVAVVWAKSEWSLRSGREPR